MVNTGTTFKPRPSEQPVESPLTFESLLQECIELHRRKDRDYSGSRPYSNFFCERMGLRADRGVMCRLLDKVERACELFAKEQKHEEPAVTDEKLEDTLQDLLNYAGIVLVVRAMLRREGKLV